jgi:hypothetical protein
MTLVVIGAGSTRGASFVKPIAGKCLPPLDGDFFTQLQRITEPKHQATITRAVEDAAALFGVNFRATLENTFTVIEHRIRMSRAIYQTRAELDQSRTNLLQAIAASLEASLAEGRTHRNCKFHEYLVDNLKPTDCIISFNYDCLIDTALQKKGDNKWNARYGYCLPLPRGRSSTIGEHHWQPDAPAKKSASIKLLKLHGSTNWRRKDESSIELKKRPYTKQRGNLNFEIIPPEWQKRFDAGVFGRLWFEASRQIHKARSLVVVGYSFPQSDQHTSALFQLSTRNDQFSKLCIVNPDREARRRTRDLLWQGIATDTRVLSFDSLEEFASVDPLLWN